MEHWQKKLPLSVCLNNELDGRTVVGLRKALERATKRNGNTVEVGRHRNYYTLVQNAVALADVAMVLSMPAEELSSKLASLESEVDSPPLSLQAALLNRRCRMLVSSRSWSELLSVITPFGDKKFFQSSSPRLIDLNVERQSQMVATYTNVVYTNMLIPMLQSGADNASSLPRSTCWNWIQQQQAACLRAGASSRLYAPCWTMM